MPARIAATVAAFVRRDFAVARSYRFPFLLSLFATGMLLVVVYEVGRLVDRTPAAGRSSDLRAGYFSFVLVGQVLLGIVHTSLQSFTAKLRQEQVTGTLEALLATPASPSLVILSSAAYELIQSVALGVVLFALGFTAGLHVVHDVGAIAVSVVALAGLVALFSALGVLVAAFTVVFKRGSTLAGLVSGLLALLGGVYFPVAQLPSAIRWLADVLPLTWGVDALRRALLFGDVETGRLLGLIGSALLLLPVALWLFGRAVDQARRTGSLAQY